MSLSHSRIEGHSALVTGASSGIGESLARDLAEAGVAHLTLVARRKDRLENLAKDLQQKHPAIGIRVIAHDLGQPGSARTLHEKIEQDSAHPPITLLFNNAGVGPYAPFVETDYPLHAATIELNVLSLVELSHLFSRSFLSRKLPASIVNIASIAGYQPVPGYAVYAATKHFVRVFSRILGHEMRKTNVRVMCVCPGGTRTEFLARAGQLLKQKGELFMMDSGDVSRAILKGIQKNQSLVIPGWLNQWICFFPRILPESWSLHFAEKSMQFAVDRTQPEAPSHGTR